MVTVMGETTSDLGKILEPLSELYSATGEDWSLSFHHCLTEPTCPTAVICPEGWRISRYRVDCGSIEESLRTVVALVKREVIDRTPIGSYAPYSDADDDAYAKWLYARAAGSDEKLPEPPCGPLPETYEWILDGFLRRSELAGKAEKYGSRGLVSYIQARMHYMTDGRIDGEAARKLIRQKLEARSSKDSP